MSALGRAVLAYELRIPEAHGDGRRGAALEHLAHVLADALEGVEPLALHLVGNELDRDAGERIGDQFANGLSTRVLGDRRDSVGRRLRRGLVVFETECEA